MSNAATARKDIERKTGNRMKTARHIIRIRLGGFYWGLWRYVDRTADMYRRKNTRLMISDLWPSLWCFSNGKLHKISSPRISSTALLQATSSHPLLDMPLCDTLAHEGGNHNLDWSWYKCVQIRCVPIAADSACSSFGRNFAHSSLLSSNHSVDVEHVYAFSMMSCFFHLHTMKRVLLQRLTKFNLNWLFLVLHFLLLIKKRKQYSHLPSYIKGKRYSVCISCLIAEKPP